MKVLLINPEKLIQPPFGLLYIGSTLKADGHEVKIFEIPFSIERDSYITLVREQIQKFSPRIIGITCMSMQTSIVKDLARDIKEKFKGALLIVGGVHPTIDSHDPVSWGADIAVRGEAEDTVL
ncbi:MAG: cobalamin B12-binding domain-containing protein, partial [Candidatus Omnitrophota bacterium]|nr:cobalamin B12-binding domain-containing protein [Candidatus Omnitrophota bacterium]